MSRGPGRDRRRRAPPSLEMAPSGPPPLAGSEPADRRVRDRRAHERVLVNIEVDYACDETFLFAYITDLSEMGIFIQTRTPHSAGTRLNLRFRPPGRPELNVEGQVMWVNSYRPGHPDNLNPGMGVQFVDLDPVQQGRVLELVKTFAYLDDDEKPLGHS